MNEQVRVRVPAKVNLALLVGGVDDAGYHELGTVFQAVSLFDDITAEAAPRGVYELNITGLGSDTLATDQRNLAIRSAALLADRYRVRNTGVRLSIHKRIPIAGGMAGGSADAAGAALACAALWDLDLSRDELIEFGAELGADVPFAALGGTAVGRGRGDQLVPMLTRGRLRWVFATSASGLSTPEVFARFDQLSGPRPVDLPDGLLSALTKGDLPGVAAGLVNDLEIATIDLMPELQEVLDLGRSAGALGAVVSGSGPTCAFLVASDVEALRVSDALGALPQVDDTFCAFGPVPGAQFVLS